MITIDGGHGEGGGQVLRSSLALALATGKPFRIERIRAGRDKPGLMRQHLAALRAAQAVGNAVVEGDEIGSTTVEFRPGSVQPGEWRFAVGTAGSATLVLQTVLPVLLTAAEPATLVLEGGTHNPFAPPFDFLDRVFLPMVNRMGPTVTAVLETPGFYPAGGGRFRVDVQPAAQLASIELLDRGPEIGRSARAIVSDVPEHVADRELSYLAQRLGWPTENLRPEVIHGGPGPGNVVMIEIDFEHVTELVTGFGARDRRAEGVADSVLQEYRRYAASTAPVGEHLADQLVVPMALARGGRFRCISISPHTRTQLDLVSRFSDVPIAIEDRGRTDGVVVSFG